MSAPLPGMSCKNCLYYEPIMENHGECRRYAPHPNASSFVPKADAVGTIKNDIHWPKVFETYWCGQFASRRKHAPDSVQSAPTSKPVRIRERPAEEGTEQESFNLLPEETEAGNG